jgi:hypothetical protein
MNNKRTLLILSSGQVSRNMAGELGPIATSNIPLPGGLFLDNLISETLSYYDNVYCTLDQSKSELGRILEHKYERLKIHYGNSKMSIAEVVLSFLKVTGYSYPNLDIVYGDSFSTSLFKDYSEENFIMVANSDGSDDWDHVKRDHSGNLVFSEGTNEIQKYCMTGSFRFNNSETLKKSLEKSLKKSRFGNNLSRNSSEFHRAIQFYDSKEKGTVKLEPDQLWKDLGHRRTYFRQRKDYISKGTRAFNSLDFDLKSGWVTKSGVSEKINAEINWFNSMPDSLNHYFPTIKKIETRNKYEIQYIPSIPLNEHWISENPNKDFWIDLIESLDEMLTSFSHHTENLSSNELRNFKHSVYVDKVKNRYGLLEELLRKNHDASSNNLHARKLEEDCATTLQEVLVAGESASILENWSIIHGDLCFSNIIYDQINESPIIIDPKGSFGKIGIYGDPLYELLKLSQCILGDYDYFAANLYSFKELNDEIVLDYPKTNEHAWIKTLFNDFLRDKLRDIGLDYETFRILEAGLFLSAAPLHSENNRWLALTLRANTILRELK